MEVSVKAGPDDDLEDGVFTAYASVFGNVDSYGDVVVKGAFDQTLKDWKSSGNTIPLLYSHRMDDPDYNIGAILEAKEDDHGLLVKGKLDLDSPKGAQVYRLLKGRRLNQLSYAYDVTDGGPARKDGEHFYELRGLKMYEVSLTPIGANQETEVLAVKAATEALSGQSLKGDSVSALVAARDTLDDIIRAHRKADDTEPDAELNEASGETEAKSEEPEGAKGEERKFKPSVDFLTAQLNLL